MLMDERSADLVPPGDQPISPVQHARFIEHLAIMHAAGLGWHDDLGLYPLERRPLFFAPETIAPELRRDDVPVPIMVADQGWGLLPEKDRALFGSSPRSIAIPAGWRSGSGRRRRPSSRATGSWAISDPAER